MVASAGVYNRRKSGAMIVARARKGGGLVHPLVCPEDASMSPMTTIIVPDRTPTRYRQSFATWT